MFRLKDLYSRVIKKPLPTECGITCERIDPRMATLNRLLTESVSCFSYTLILSGNQTIDFDDKHASLSPGDIFISTPGMRVYTKTVSEDYRGLCLMAEETVTYEIPYARNVIKASYFPLLIHLENKLTLTECETKWMKNRMNEILEYVDSDHVYKNECLYSLYSLFILDLLNVETRLRTEGETNGRTIDVFLKFLQLVKENFIDHHEIAFYADRLAVTTIYLSRIVKKISGQTVKHHIDRMLLMEANYLLISTDIPIAVIAERLNFATPAGFSKFFTRYKGLSPREYRASGPFNGKDRLT